MNDKNGVEIRVGDLVKKEGQVKYAHGPRLKLSKKTWVAGEQDGKLGLFLGDAWEPFFDHTTYLVVGNIGKGLNKEYTPLSKIQVATVFQKYRLLKDVPAKNWKVGEVVRTNGKVDPKDDTFEWVADNIAHQHTVVVVDPIAVDLAVKNK